MNGYLLSLGSSEGAFSTLFVERNVTVSVELENTQTEEIVAYFETTTSIFLEEQMKSEKRLSHYVMHPSNGSTAQIGP